MKKLLKIIGIIILIPIVLIIGLLVIAAFVPAVPNNFTKEVETGGGIEAKYLAMGKYKVKSTKSKATELTKYNYVYYPEELENSNKEYPVVVVLNGTGILPKKYKALFKHLSSWGFIVVGNDDKDSVLYKKIDLDNIGITGHSQGGAGVFTAITIMEHKDKYKTAVALSPTHEETALTFGWNYNLTKVSIPTLIIAGTQGDFETQMVIPIEKMINMYQKIPAPKVMMRRIGAEHGQMQYSAGGYVTAWFMWQLQGDKETEKAFIGDSPELLTNKLYQDQRIDIEN